MIQILPTFHGMDSEKPYLHIREFEDTCETFGDQSCPQDVIRLKLFPFSLKDKAKTWLWSLPPNSVLSWRDMQAKFLSKNFPQHKINSIKAQIQAFRQNENEAFDKCWKRALRV